MNKFLKYLLCITLTIIVVNFLTSLTSFLRNTDTYLTSARITAKPNDEETIDMGQKVEKQLDSTINDLKEDYGENYPALGIMYYKAISHYSSVTVVQNFIFSLIAGFSLGHLIYFIFITKLSNVKAGIMIILGLVITATLLALSDIYTSIANSEVVKFGISEILWNMEVSAITYFIVYVLLKGFNKIYQTYHEIRYSDD